MKEFDPYLLAIIGVLIVIPVTAILLIHAGRTAVRGDRWLEPDCDTKLYTESWPEARQFARECEATGGTVTLRPRWRSQEDRPYGATIICSR
jgi:hypothetical protein